MKILVLDFDGVICDSADETARAGWLAGSFLWPEWAKHDITPSLVREFRKLRPLLHTGFEAVAILKAIEEKYSTPFIKSNYHFIMRQIFTSSQYNFDELKAIMNKVREDWIRINERDWLSRQRLFPGISDFIYEAQQDYDHVYILTTREGKFAKRLLENAGVDFEREYILGLETAKDKTDSLDELIGKYCPDLKIDISEGNQEASANISEKSGSGNASENSPALVEAEMKKAADNKKTDGKTRTVKKSTVNKVQTKKSSSEIIFLDDRYLTLEKIAKDERS